MVGDACPTTGCTATLEICTDNTCACAEGYAVGEDAKTCEASCMY